ncbi:bifunctional diaminohydroxyphosphoribosylaminopyrimidine deaminase/5-amino-6-(5-phosphoribosylamino)uracil reductase RibD [Pelagerythrobacter marinus]|uniref:bifunctional diaminohydroxyphosphoribosylaminopyrimidine deaminase/5-amino-6-(5-phosphoribosylamino)uracil reductase RibD n=1 Tax=Pelagerythrobacter marinus TaxID=538382 RepID=UPI0020371488|nr:bifunctional diaminohydroxyphosphoribosylaminopyrimidine deaminase/5-amino-6-(5-phosphoribosylamino)uracil reductase RibD [Pelagerythrobacter marinus]USA38686.1 bifunctional diaminohydroxyphosphoribosylaminopyrimidine deaminase/5-amino-6-(5-phosphoribosylamino)uracil reductase RibD [Pelagerythrobacter marinus]WPZ07287.1 bifunctional diaminohydroxyphosphoribosylaminopyrimidine deaminase/5-amino-6-(5-phosphoribosylamino)uracil reductase RibD [Pelagerythrobacter marinus]
MPNAPNKAGAPERADDARWLAAAARLAARGRPLSRPNPAVGCLVVRDGIVVGRGWTRPGGRPHAEAVALAEAGESARGASVYVTLEPCAHRAGRGPACSDLLVEARPARVVVGQRDPDERTRGRGIERLGAAGIAVALHDCPASRASLAGYLAQAEHGRPHVTLKLATSLDGAIATAGGESRWITGPAARAHVHSRRAMADAILVGGGTWRADAPRLDVRLPGLEARSPRRLVLSRSIAAPGVETLPAPAAIAGLEAVQYLYVEGGAGAAAAFLAADLVDRIELYRAPIVVGGGAGAIGDIGLASLAAAHGRWRLAERRQLGSDTFEAYRRQGQGQPQDGD